MANAAVLFLCWFTATLTYYGLGFSAGDMAGGLYANSIALSAVDVPGNIMYAVFANRPWFGRRRTQAIFFGFGGCCLLVAPIAAAAGHPLPSQALRGLAIAGKVRFSTDFPLIFDGFSSDSRVILVCFGGEAGCRGRLQRRVRA